MDILHEDRNSNLELLRIVSMAMIIAFHYVYKGGFDFESGGTIINRMVYDFVYHFGEIGVNCFVLISGYFFDKTTFSWKKVIKYAIMVEFYLLLGNAILICFFDGNKIDLLNYKQYIYPILGNKYWFVSAYMLIYIISPYLKKMIVALEKTELKRLLIIELIIWSIYPTLGLLGLNNGDTEAMPYYNRYIWLLVMYFMGAYIKLYGIRWMDDLKKSVVLFIIVILGLFLFVFFEEYMNMQTEMISAVYFWRPNSIVVFLLSLTLFCIFKYMKIGINWTINYIASCTLGVYMLHDGVLANVWWYDIFKNAMYQYSRKFPFMIIIAVVIIFICGVAIESILKFIDKYLELKLKKIKVKMKN